MITEATAIKMTEPLAVNPAGQKQPDADASAFITRGDELFARGDFSAARLFYQRAADRGDATAAVRIGETTIPGSWLKHVSSRKKGTGSRLHVGMSEPTS